MRCGGIFLALVRRGFVRSERLSVDRSSETRDPIYEKRLQSPRHRLHRPHGRRDSAWITEAAKEGRPDQKVEKDPDQWWRKYVMSEKARSIERDLGFE